MKCSFKQWKAITLCPDVDRASVKMEHSAAASTAMKATLGFASRMTSVICGV